MNGCTLDMLDNKMKMHPPINNAKFDIDWQNLDAINPIDKQRSKFACDLLFLTKFGKSYILK